MPFATQVVSMPRWSTPIGCTKLALSIIVLALMTGCCAIWGPYPAFSLSIFTASLSLVVFGYYLTALSFRPQLYNKWVVVVLESLLTLFWFLSPTLLAGWLAASTAYPQWTLNVPVHGTTSYDSIGLNSRDLTYENFKLWSSPLDLIKRERQSLLTTPVRLHGQNTQHAARILAGISIGLASLNFMLYGATLMMFSINMTKLQLESVFAPTDEEAHTVTVVPARTYTSSSAFQPGSAMPPVITQPLRVNTLPKDFEPKPQTQEHYLSPEQAAEAGIEPPTPVLRAQMAEKERMKEDEKASEQRGKDRAGMSAPKASRGS